MFPTNNSIDLAIGTVYSTEYINQFKKRLQITQGMDMILCQNPKELSISCSNEDIRICPFTFQFAKIIDVDSRQTGLQLKKVIPSHSSFCNVNNQEISFERNRSLITQSKDMIANIMLSRYKSYGPQNPKKILEIISQTLGFDEIFIKKGLNSNVFKRKLKKKFDNLVAEIRRQHNLNPTKIKSSNKIIYKQPKTKFSLLKYNHEEDDNQQENQQRLILQSQDDLDEESQFLPSRISKSRNGILQSNKNQKQSNKQTDEYGQEANSYQCQENSSRSVKTGEFEKKRLIQQNTHINKKRKVLINCHQIDFKNQ